MYYGDIFLGQTVDIKFTTRNTSGQPATLSGSPVVVAYLGNSTTEINGGITLTTNFDSVIGLHNLRVAATSTNGYTSGTDVFLTLSAGRVASIPVSGEVVGSFSIQNRSALMPVVSGRRLDIDSTYSASANIVKILGTTLTETAGYLAAGFKKFFNVVTPTLTMSGVDQTGDSFARLGPPILTVSADISAVNQRLGPPNLTISADISATKAVVDALPTSTQNADALLNRDMSAVSDTNARTPLNALRFLRNKWAVASTTLTVKKEDDSTDAWTATVTPDAGASPIVGNDPT